MSTMRLSTTWSKEYWLFSFLIVFVNVQSVVNQVTFVRREAGNHDVFGSTTTLNCNSYGNAGISGRNCLCPQDKSTFLYFKNTCVPNSFLKTKLNIQTGCFTKFEGQYDTPYYVFDLSKNYSKQATTFQDITQINGNNCVVAGKINYINDLGGKLLQTSSPGVSFKIDKHKKRLRWNIVSSPSVFDGKIIRLDTQDCTFKKNQQSVINPCFAFKIQGTLSFSTSTSSTTSISKKTSTMTTLPGTLTPTSTIHGRSTTVVPFNPTDTAGHRKNKSKDSSPIAAIVGALVAVIGVVIVVVLLVVWRRRKRNQNEEKEKDTNKGNPTYGRGETIDLSNQHNLRNTDNEFEYDYAAVDGDPRSSSNAAPGIYQSLTKDPNRESVYTPSDRQQDIPSDQSTGYDKVERPIFKPARKGPTDPLYNVLGRPNEGQLQPGTHDKPTGQSTGYDKVEHPVFQPPRKGPTDPLYNVLERPNGTNHDYMEPGVNIDKNNKAPQNNEPVYNVLEGPGEDPDYNVLEDPNEQYEPEYNVLEGPGDNPDNVPVDGHDNVGYASTIDIKSRGAPIYAAPEGPISEPTYQPLIIGGPDESVYQPLDRKSRVVPDDQPLYHVLESTTSDA